MHPALCSSSVLRCLLILRSCNVKVNKGLIPHKMCVHVRVPAMESLPFFSLWQSSCPSAFCCVCCRLSLWQTSNAWPTVRTIRMAWLWKGRERESYSQNTFMCCHLLQSTRDISFSTVMPFSFNYFYFSWYSKQTREVKLLHVCQGIFSQMYWVPFH